MKLVKMSLAAAVLMGASAFAIDNVKVSGDAKLFYNTSDQGTDTDLFDQAGAAADTALRLSVTGDLTKGVSFGATGYAVSTLGLENNLVGATWTSAHDGVKDASWMGELWLAATMGKTTAKLGRMELDTPLAFTEKWNIVPNTYEAAVLINQDIPDTTLVGAWVGRSNVNAGAGFATTVATNGAFTTFGSEGAYAAGIVNNSFKPLVAQAWYYNVLNVATAYWLQADLDCQLVKGVKLGAQYTDAESAAGTDLAATYAFKVAYAGIQNLNVSAAYSKVQDKVAAINSNVGGQQSKLYTEAWWNYTKVGQTDTEAYNLTAEYDAGIAKLGAYYTNADKANTDLGDMDEIALVASKAFGPLDVSAAYVNTALDGGDRFNQVQAYLTLNF